jgi:hypothetical protein
MINLKHSSFLCNLQLFFPLSFYLQAFFKFQFIYFLSFYILFLKQTFETINLSQGSEF